MIKVNESDFELICLIFNTFSVLKLVIKKNRFYYFTFQNVFRQNERVNREPSLFPKIRGRSFEKFCPLHSDWISAQTNVRWWKRTNSSFDLIILGISSDLSMVWFSLITPHVFEERKGVKKRTDRSVRLVFVSDTKSKSRLPWPVFGVKFSWECHTKFG